MVCVPHYTFTPVFFPVVQSASFRAQSAKMESVSARKKVVCVRQENTCLTMQDEQLLGDVDALQYELATSMSQV